MMGPMHDNALPFSPACLRNQDPILAVLHRWLPSDARVLEVGSGSGQHAIHMARHLPGVHWQPSERPEALAGLAARIALEGREGLAPGAAVANPLLLDVCQAEWPAGPFEAVFTANTLHIMPAGAVPFLLAGSARVLSPGGLLLVYGPFRYGARHTAESNAHFDAHLRSLDPAMGVRDAEALIGEASALGLHLLADKAMPANNRLLVFRQESGGPEG
jgi:SAM-dependent methyltransferase